LILCILDGWGEGKDDTNNAIAMARTPVFDRLKNRWPKAVLNTSESEVGLPKGQVGNSEVGHATIGAGRIVPQGLTRINESIRNNTLGKTPELIKLINTLKKSGGSCHLLGLLSSGGVHSHQNHISALANTILSSDVPVILHAILDGRDTPPKQAINDVKVFLSKFSKHSTFSIGSVTGRYYAMDRDKRWDRIQKAWQAIQMAKGNLSPDIVEAIRLSYAAKITDEFFLPTVVKGYSGVKSVDSLLVANFRADRIREILTALTDPNFCEFSRPDHARFLEHYGMVPYSDKLDKVLSSLFPTVNLENTLGEIVSKAGLSQLRVAETEKYAHVTFFFNGGRELPFDGEKRIMIPSPNVSTYDQKPDMSAADVTNSLVSAIAEKSYDLIVVNFANGDMVGHTGVLRAAKSAVETIDHCLGRIEQALSKSGGLMLITADHGNCESMVDFTNDQPHTSHTMNPVPIILVGAPEGITGLKNGRLSDVAPTLLALLNINKPKSMTGKSLLRGPAAQALVAAE